MDITGALAIVLIFGGGTLFLLAISPVGRAIAERIRRPGGGALPEDVRGELDELRSELTGEVHQLRTEVSELSEWTSRSGCSPSSATLTAWRRRGDPCGTLRRFSSCSSCSAVVFGCSVRWLTRSPSGSVARALRGPMRGVSRSCGRSCWANCSRFAARWVSSPSAWTSPSACSRRIARASGSGRPAEAAETRSEREAYSVTMLQGPPTPPPPGLDWTFLLDQAMPIVAMIVLFIGLRWVLQTPVGEALAERIRTKMRGRPGGIGEDPHRVTALEGQVAQLPGQVAELAERLDFAEGRAAARRGRACGGAGGAGRPREAGAAAAQRARAGRGAAARDVGEAPRGDGEVEALAAAAQRPHRRREAQEEHPDRTPEARRGAQADSGDDVVHRRQECVRDVRAHGRADRARGAEAHRRRRGERGLDGRPAREAVPGPRGEGRRRPAAARPEAQAGAAPGGLARRVQAARQGRGRGRAGRG